MRFKPETSLQYCCAAQVSGLLIPENVDVIEIIRRHILRKRFYAVLIAVIMIAQCMTCTSVFADSKDKSPVLIKSVKVYNINYKTQKWEKDQKRSFTYKKKYPKKMSIYDYSLRTRTSRSYKYTFSGSIPKKMIMKRSDSDDVDTYKYTKRGLISNIITGPDKTGKRVMMFIYGNKNYFTTVLHDHIWVEGGKDGESAYEYGEEVDSVAVTARKNGLLKKTVNRGIFANYSYAEKRKWKRFYGVYTVDYDSDGIVQQTSARFRSFPGSGPKLRFKVYRKNGLITKVVRYNWNEDANKGKGVWEKDQKFIFEYTNTKIDRIRYASMINSQIMDESNNYYIYNWY